MHIRDHQRRDFPRRRALQALLALPIALVGAATAGSAFAQTTSNRNRLVIQVSDADPKKWALALNNAKNVQQDLGKDKVDIEIVAYGPGIDMLNADSEASPGVIQSMTDGVKVIACENTMRNRKLKREDMQGGISYVGAGVVEIMQKQRQGWSYIRP